MTDKLKSRKLWITIWAMGMLTYGLIAQVELSWFGALAPILGTIVAVYIGINGYLAGKRKPEEIIGK